jgi:hypothetical protein
MFAHRKIRKLPSLKSTFEVRPAEANRRFGGTYSVFRVKDYDKQATSKKKVASMASACCFYLLMIVFYLLL